MKHIGIFVGTRPEAIKLIPIYFALQKDPTFKVSLISTGQHKEMLEQVFQFFGLTPDFDLALMTANQSLAQLSAKLLVEVDKLLKDLNIDMVIVQGDTTTCMAASLSAFYNKRKIAHVEAGLRTYDKYSPFPEEVNRKITGIVADLHFAPTQRAAESLALENIKTNVFITGNTVIDSLIYTKDKVANSESSYSKQFPFLRPSKKTILITGHRRENFGEGFKNICEAIKELAERYPEYSFVYPVHLNPNVREIVHEMLGNMPNIYLIEPLGYDSIVYLMSKSYIIMTDSGGIQEEAPSLGVPVLVLRNTTERPEAVDAGCCKLVGNEKSVIVESFVELVEDKNLYLKMSSKSNPYGDGKTSDRISEIVRNYLQV